MRKWLFSVSLLGLSLHLSFALDSSGRWLRLTILHTNDTHGHLLPFSYPQGIAPDSPAAQMPFKENIGGIARRATLIKNLRETLHGQTLVIDAGDYMDGTPFSLEFLGEADVACMDAVGYEFATLGNHEFSNSLPQIQKLLAMSRCTNVLANARLRANGQPLCQPYVVVERFGLKIALFGLIVRDTQNYRGAREGVEILDPFETARQLVPQLRSQADLVILISHLGYEDDQRLAREVPGIDVIVGGHSHTRLTAPTFIEWRQKDAPNLGGTLIVQAFQWGGELGRLDLTFWRNPDTNRWEMVAYRGQLIPITADIPEDPATRKVLDGYWKRIARRYGRVVGVATDDFVQRGNDYAHYNLVSDAIRETFGSEFDIQNMFGVRIELAKGAITYYDLARMLPFGNTIVRFEIRGRDLKALLQRHRPTVSGIRYRVENGRLVQATLNGEPIQDDKLYKGTTNSYFAGRVLTEMGISFVDTGRTRLDVVADYIRRHKRVSPVYDGRRVVR